MWYQQVVWRSNFRAPSLTPEFGDRTDGLLESSSALLSLQPRGEMESKEHPTNIDSITVVVVRYLVLMSMFVFHCLHCCSCRCPPNIEGNLSCPAVLQGKEIEGESKAFCILYGTKVSHEI